MRGLEGDFSDSNNKISAIRVSESISTQRSPYATIPSLRFVTRVHYDFFLSRSLSFSLHYLHFVHCSSHFFSFSRVTRERYIYIYTHIRVVEHMEMMRRIEALEGVGKRNSKRQGTEEFTTIRMS